MNRNLYTGYLEMATETIESSYDNPHYVANSKDLNYNLALA